MLDAERQTIRAIGYTHLAKRSLNELLNERERLSRDARCVLLRRAIADIARAMSMAASVLAYDVDERVDD